MNAVTKTETIALETVAPLEVADPTKNLILVPLSQLLPRRSKRNVRTTPRQSIPELAASIARVGLLQNLIVIAAADGEQYEVVAGDRRLTALKLLAKKKRITADYEVPCLLVADASARTVSLAENVQREAMHPADQFAAFAALVKEGRPIEDIAADFGVSLLVVQRRLKLANVSPRLLADYRSGNPGAVTLEQLMALTITDDHAAQEAAYYGAPEWQRGASALRDRLTEREITATHPLVGFVGLDAYTQAGGGIRRDLFAEGDAGTYLTDAALLETLVRDKLDAQAEDVRAEGWAWVEAVPHMSHADRQTFQNAPRQRREPTAREARRLASLHTRLDKLDAELEEAYDADDEDKAEALEPRREQVVEELQTIEEGLRDYTPDVRAVAGAIVTLDREGEAVIHRGLLREAEAKALRTLEKLRQGFGAGDGANAEARMAPAREGYVNAIQVWPFTDGALYQVYAAPGHVTVISLQAGEELVTVAAGDTVRWIVGDTSSGAGNDLRVSVLVKPIRSGLKTNLVVTTSRRTYLIELTSTDKAWMASVSWEYPKDQMLALQRQDRAAQAAAPVDTGLSLEKIRFRYAVNGSNPPWKPLRAFDDGEKVYIQFPPGIAQGELPPLFVIGAQGGGQLVNYRFRSPYYIVDRLFGAAELRLGGDKGDVVRIERTDGTRGN